MRNKNLRIDNLRIVVFDWDNTLAETRTPLIYSVNRVLEEYGLPDWKISKQLRDPNLSFRDNFPRIFGEKAEEAYERYVEIYLNNVAGLISTFKNTDKVLRFFHDHHILMTIMTNKDRRLLEFELPLLFDRTLFIKIVCGHEAERDKPFPEHARYTLRGLIKDEDISPETVWIIGDSPQDSSCACGINALPIRIGESIWGDDEKHGDKIIYYRDFGDFYRRLLHSADN